MLLSVRLSFALGVFSAGGFQDVRVSHEIVWDTDGLIREQLVSRVSQGTGQPFVLGASAAPPPERLLCTAEALDVDSAIALAERAFGLVGWDLDGTVIWLQEKDTPNLVLADISPATRVEMPPVSAAKSATGDVELDNAIAAEAIRRVGLAFGVVFVYSERCVGLDQRLSLAMDGVDFETCFSILKERFGLQSVRVGNAILLEPVDASHLEDRRTTDSKARIAPAAGSATYGNAELYESDRLDREEAAKLCSRIGGKG